MNYDVNDILQQDVQLKNTFGKTQQKMYKKRKNQRNTVFIWALVVVHTLCGQRLSGVPRLVRRKCLDRNNGDNDY